MDDSSNNFGRRLKTLRESAGFTSPEAFATAIDVSKQSVYNWEKRVTPPPPSRLQKIADGLEMTVAELLDPQSRNVGQVQEPGRRAWELRSEDPAPYGAGPATRGTIEHYIRQRCDEADRLNNPNVYPWFLGKLMEHFPEGFANHFPAMPRAESRRRE